MGACSPKCLLKNDKTAWKIIGARGNCLCCICGKIGAESSVATYITCRPFD